MKAPPLLLTRVDLLDELLDAHAAALGRDFTAYRNHAYRVLNLCVAQSSDAPGPLERIAVAAAFHDLGIWTDATFDYLPPSVRLASAHLLRTGRVEQTSEVSAMILEHHKITRYRGDADSLVEPFRRADWMDVTRGVVRFGLPRGLVREIFARWPSAGFHGLLVRLELTRLRTHPFSPLPMIRL